MKNIANINHIWILGWILITITSEQTSSTIINTTNSTRPSNYTLQSKSNPENTTMYLPTQTNPRPTTHQPIPTKTNTSLAKDISSPLSSRMKRNSLMTRSFICPVYRCTKDDCQIYTLTNTKWIRIDQNRISVEEDNNKVTLTDATTNESFYWCAKNDTINQLSKTQSQENMCIEHPDWPPNVQFDCNSFQTTDNNKHHPNSAITMIRDFAAQQEYDDCWICQQIPHSANDPTFYPIQFQLQDWRLYNWQLRAEFLQYIHKNLFTTKKCTNKIKGKELLTSYTDIERKILNKFTHDINTNHLPVSFDQVQMIEVTDFVQISPTITPLVHKIQATFFQTTDDSNHLPSLRCSAISTVVQWRNSFSYEEVSCQIVDCKNSNNNPLHDNFNLRGQTMGNHKVKIFPLTNVTLCFDIIPTNNSATLNLGQTLCSGPIYRYRYSGNEIRLPERVFLICGEFAYTKVPALSKGRCYLSHLIPLVRRVSNIEIRYMHNAHTHTQVKRRAFTNLQAGLGILFAPYGVYLTEMETRSLSIALEKHINASDIMASALLKEVNEIKSVVLSNRYALDQILSTEGGTCAVIGQECCSYISSANDSVQAFHNANREQIKLLKTNWNWTPMNYIDNFFNGTWSFSHWLFTSLLTIIIVMMIVSILIKCFIRWTNNITGIQAFQNNIDLLHTLQPQFDTAAIPHQQMVNHILEACKKP